MTLALALLPGSWMLVAVTVTLARTGRGLAKRPVELIVPRLRLLPEGIPC
jgi:hypothetical protein